MNVVDFPKGYTHDQNALRCIKCNINLLVYPKTIHPAEITKFLSIQPTEENVVGGSRANRYGKTFRIPLSSWFLLSDRDNSSLELSDHLDWFLDKIQSKAEIIKKLRDTDGISIRLEGTWWSALAHGGPTLRPEQLRRLSELDLELALSACYYGDE